VDEAIEEVVPQWVKLEYVRRAVVGSGIVQSTVSLDAVISGLHVFKAYSFTYVVREVCLGCAVCLSLSILARERSLGITTF
jgi:hypothetical protein